MDKHFDRCRANRAPDEKRRRQRIEGSPDDTTRLPRFNQVSGSLDRDLIDPIEPRSDIAITLSELEQNQAESAVFSQIARAHCQELANGGA